MKAKIFLVILLQLMAGILCAQIQLDKKSTIFPVGTNSKMYSPKFAVNTLTDETLIVWLNQDSLDSEDAIVARIVNANGKTVGKAFTIVKLAAELSIAYNPNTNEFLLVYAEGDGGGRSKILVLRLAADGRPRGKAIDITSHDPSVAPYTNGGPTLKFNPKTGGYTLLFLKTGGVGVRNDSAYYYALLNEKGELSGSLQKIEECFPGNLLTFFIDFAYLPSADKLLMLAYLYLREDHNEPRIAFLDYGLAAVDIRKLKNLKRPDFQKISRVLNPDPNQSRAFLRIMVASLGFPSAASPIAFYRLVRVYTAYRGLRSIT